MKFTVTRPLKLQTSSGPKLYEPGEIFQADLEKAQIYLDRGLLKFIEEDTFETLRSDLWPSLIHCSWSDLTGKEKVEWESAIRIQGQAESTGDIQKWREMEAILLKIAEDAKGREKVDTKELMTYSLEEFRSQSLAVRIRSKVLGEDVWLVSNEMVRDHLKAEGLVCYLTEEIPQLRGLSPDDLRAIHTVKRVFEKGHLVEMQKGRDY